MAYYAVTTLRIEENDRLVQIFFEPLPVQGVMKISYAKINAETFNDARTEMTRDMGWGSWTDDLAAIWSLLNIDADELNRRVTVHPSQSNAGEQTIIMDVPATVLDWNYNGIAGLLSLIAGDVLGSTGVGQLAKITSVSFPDSVRRHFPGPRLGIEGIRELCQVDDRPIVAFSVKPRIGLSTPEFARVCRAAALGGVNIVEDDERLSNQSLSPLVERAEAALQETQGTATIYSANITGRADVAVDVAKELIDLGVRMLKIDVLPTGFSALQAVSEYIHRNKLDVGITVYPAMNKLFEKVIPRDVLLELCRWCGADVVYAGVPPLPNAQRHHDAVPFENAAEHHRLLKQQSPFHRAVLPTISTHITPLNIGAYTALSGPNVGFFVGAGISAYTGSVTEGTQLLMRAVREPRLSARDLKQEQVDRLEQSFGEGFILHRRDQ